MKNNYNSIPEEWRNINNWICYKTEPNPKNHSGFDKIPINPITGRFASSTDPSTWTDFETAVNSSEKYAGIGFVFNGSGYFGVDIDDRPNEVNDFDNGKTDNLIYEFASKLKSYTELSVSGNGIHIICKGKLPGDDFNNRSEGIEMYGQAKFFVVTGVCASGYETINDCTETIKPFYERFKTNKSLPESKMKPLIHYSSNLSDSEIIEKAINSKNGEKFRSLYLGDISGYASHSEATMALCCMLAFWCGGNAEKMDSIFRSSGLMRPKWDSKRGSSTWGRNEIEKAINACKEYYNPNNAANSKSDNAHSNEWGEIQTFDKNVTVQPFDTSLLPGFLKEFVDNLCESLQVKPEMFIPTLLSVLALALQKKVVIEKKDEGYQLNLNLYTLTVANVGQRKSSAFNTLFAPVNEYQNNFNLVRQNQINDYLIKKEMLENQKRKLSGKAEDFTKAAKELLELKPVYKLELNANDVTPEALAELMSKQGEKIGILGDEGGIFNILCGMYSNGTSNIDLFLNAYDGSSYSVHRRTKDDIILNSPLLTIGLMIQPSLLMNIVNNKVFEGRGLIHRFLFAFHEREAGYLNYRSSKISDELYEKYELLIKKLLSMPVLYEIPVIKCDQDADNVFEEYFNHLQYDMRKGKPLSYIIGWADKQQTRCMKIAGILHMCFKSPSELLDEDTAKRAVGIAMWSESHALKALNADMMTEHELNAQYVIRRLKESGKLQLKKREVLRLCRRLNSNTIEEPLEILESMNYIKWEVEKDSFKKGRPSETIYVNPKVKDIII